MPAPRTEPTRQLSASERTVLRALAQEHAPESALAPRILVQLQAYLEDVLLWTRDSNLVAQNDPTVRDKIIQRLRPPQKQ